MLVVGATNRPGDLDDAARRRLTKRLYVPLPDQTGRVEMMENLLKRESHSLTPGDIQAIAERTEGRHVVLLWSERYGRMADARPIAGEYLEEHLDPKGSTVAVFQVRSEQWLGSPPLQWFSANDWHTLLFLGFSCDDLKKMCQEAALGPVRRVFDLAAVSTEQVNALSYFSHS